MSTASPMVITKDEGTAAERTLLFHLTLTSDHIADATGKAPVATLSKAGGAFAAAAGAVTELANGWYKLVLAAADVDTVGQLGVLVTAAASDPCRVILQVERLDVNDGNAAGLANISAMATEVAAITTSVLPSRSTSHPLGSLTTAARTSAAKSLLHAINGRIDVAGVFGGGSVQVQVTEDLVNWTNYGAAKVAAGNVAITEPHRGVRAVLAGGDGTTAVVTTLTIASNN